MDTTHGLLIKYTKLVDSAAAPIPATAGACAYDLTVTSSLYDPRTKLLTLGFGIAMEIPDGVAGILLARSSVSKRGLSLANGLGLIDSDYRGELMAKFYSITPNFNPYHVGEIAAQILFLPLPKPVLVEAQTLTVTARGTGGFGSTNVRINIYNDIINPGESNE